jgi:hypothetical protein
LARPPRKPGFLAADAGLVHLDRACQPVPARAYQHCAEPVQHRPRGRVRADLQGQPTALNRISPLRFIVGLGVVSALAYTIYEGARSIIGPYLGWLGATAAVVGLVTGVGALRVRLERDIPGHLSEPSGTPPL